MIKNCKQCSVKFEITQEDLDFYDKIEVPAPKQCPKCRLVRRLQERNARKLYEVQCNMKKDYIDVSWKSWISSIWI